MKVIFCGYNWIGCKSLSILLNEGHEVFVYTHDSPPHINSLVDLCKKLKINYSTERINIKNIPFIPDIICSIFYRYIIKTNLIQLVKNKIFNLHPSLLPEYKGCSSLTWAMINGESEVGYTYHYITPRIDEGNLLIQKSIKIEEWDTQVTLYHRVMFEAGKEFLNAFDLVCKGFPGIPQAKTGDYYSRGCPHDGKINDEWSLEKKERFVRAMNYPPLPYASYGDKEIKTYSELSMYCL